MKTLNGSKLTESQALKKKFLGCFSARANNTSVLRETVKALTDRGFTRKMLVSWAVEAGYSKGYVSSLMSQILCSLGMRANRVGAGRKPSPCALELLAISQQRYGKKFLNVLRAAWRAGKAQVATGDSKGGNCGTTIIQDTASGRQLWRNSVITKGRSVQIRIPTGENKTECSITSLIVEPLRESLIL
jgi:hypothetical protein